MRLPDPAPTTMVRFHASMMVVWILVTPVTILFPKSVLWVALMSQYANFVGHFASFDAARAEKSNSSKSDTDE
jgi:hypothetical protein